jgi:hypothetical protein
VLARREQLTASAPKAKPTMRSMRPGAPGAHQVGEFLDDDAVPRLR